MPKRRVGESESTSSLAKKLGFFWETIWNHPENAELKAKRKDPNVLSPDDIIFIPDKTPKEESKPSDAQHNFVRKGEPAKIKMQLMKFGEPRKNEEYVVVLNGKVSKGKTDGDGNLEYFIPGETASGTLSLKAGREVYPLKVGHLDPVDEIRGVQQRLNNLGFMCGAEDNHLGKKLKAALEKFQATYEMEVTGEITDATKNKLKELSK